MYILINKMYKWGEWSKAHKLKVIKEHAATGYSKNEPLFNYTPSLRWNGEFEKDTNTLFGADESILDPFEIGKENSESSSIESIHGPISQSHCSISCLEVSTLVGSSGDSTQNYSGDLQKKVDEISETNSKRMRRKSKTKAGQSKYLDCFEGCLPFYRKTPYKRARNSSCHS